MIRRFEGMKEEMSGEKLRGVELYLRRCVNGLSLLRRIVVQVQCCYSKEMLER